SSRIRIQDSVVTINPTSSFIRNTQYNIMIESGAFFAVGKPTDIFPGITNNTELSFTTGSSNDRTAPTVKTYSPNRNSNTAGVNGLISLTFSEPVYVKNGIIEIREYDTEAL